MCMCGQYILHNTMYNTCTTVPVGNNNLCIMCSIKIKCYKIDTIRIKIKSIN